jgi:16S rRNA (uracil1498-N3)-methyltransferase
MSIPFFYLENCQADDGLITMPEDVSKHIVSVLRMKEGELLHLTDGKGLLLTATIIRADRKKCQLQQTARETRGRMQAQLTLAVSMLKNSNRFEWMLEKVTEIGVQSLIPLVCSRTEKQRYRADRMRQIMISAMLQSRQVWLPLLSEPAPFGEVIAMTGFANRFIPHCLPDQKENLRTAATGKGAGIILIGPEGDFTGDEINLATTAGYLPVRLGDNRLRTETAAVVAASLYLVS